MPKKITKYNIILKQFTKINSKLSEERKLSIKQRRKIIKDIILPQYENTPPSRIRIKPLKALISVQIDAIPPKEICDLNYIDTSEFSLVEFYSLDETIRELVPDCVYVKVTAGAYGSTRIFNTRNYEYGGTGIRAIVEAIRPDAYNSSGKFIFSGYKKLRPRKKNDGNAENYYLDFILFIIDSNGNEEPQGEAEAIEYEVPASRENTKKKNKVKGLIESKIKSLKVKRDSKKRARQTVDKNLSKFAKITKKVNTKVPPSAAVERQRNKDFARTSELIEKYYKEGKITKAQYDAKIEALLKMYLK
jgi:hypothetical protein